MSKKKRIDMSPLKLPNLNGEMIHLSNEDMAHIRELQVNISNLKIALADAYIKSKKHDETLTEAVIGVEKLTNEYMEEAKKIARDHGVDIDAPDQGQWNLDLNAQTLSKVG